VDHLAATGAQLQVQHVSSNSTPAWPPQLLPMTLTNRNGNTICQQQAILMGKSARTHRHEAQKLRNSDTQHDEPWNALKLVWRQSAWLCAQLVSEACIQAIGTGYVQLG
jgi:hypothetical protein